MTLNHTGGSLRGLTKIYIFIKIIAIFASYPTSHPPHGMV